ncbi:MAG: Hpt domain-containing protein, partial [Myxococcales bacterium]|nr:Hpt domain-containing protein [Myxococcales bacterium]
MNAAQAIQDLIDTLPTMVTAVDREALSKAGRTLVELSEQITDRSSILLSTAGNRLVEGLPSDLAQESIIAILTTALAAVIEGMGDLPLDDDAVDAHLHGLRALEPIPGLDTPLDAGPAEDAPVDGDAGGDDFLMFGAADALPFEQPTGEMLRIFQVEAQDLLSTCESRLLELETDPAAPGALAELFRSLHSFKGNCGFLGFGVMERLAHAAESLLVHVKEGRRTLDDDVISALIYAVDGLVQGVEQAGEG